MSILKQLLITSTPALVPLTTEEEYVQALLICYKYECENGIENWRYITGFDNRYEASNLGNIRSRVFRKPSLLKPIIKGNHLYINVIISPGNRKQYRLDYLIASTYWVKPKHSKKVLHKDGNPQNCIITNLEWN